MGLDWTLKLKSNQFWYRAFNSGWLPFLPTCETRTSSTFFFSLGFWAMGFCPFFRCTWSKMFSFHVIFLIFELFYLFGILINLRLE